MIKPIKNYILAKAFKEDSLSMGGIIVPESYRKDGSKVEILAVGEGTVSRPMAIKPGLGYRIKGAGDEIEYNNEKYYLLDQAHIIALEN
jgi:co-chaperonin GroES (HSP10)